MKFLKLFESFVNNLNLNEIEFTKHWALERGGDHVKSRVYTVSEKYPEGFYLDRVFFEQNRTKTELKNDEIESGLLGMENVNYTLDDLNDFIGFGIESLVKSRRLEDFKLPENEKCILDLGKIEIIVNDIIARPYFTFVSLKDDGTQYVNRNTERLFGFVNENKGLTFFMLSEDPGELHRKKNTFKSKFDTFIFGGIKYPYGKDFKLKINLNLDSYEDVEKNIVKQIEG